MRQFARASGQLAKTDAIDVAVLAHYAEAMEPQLRELPDANVHKLDRNERFSYDLSPQQPFFCFKVKRGLSIS